MKSYLLYQILLSNDIFSEEFKRRLSLALPKGINCSKVCTDKEFYNLEKEFNIQLDRKIVDYKIKRQDVWMRCYNIHKIINYCDKHNCEYSPYYIYDNFLIEFIHKFIPDYPTIYFSCLIYKTRLKMFLTKFGFKFKQQRIYNWYKY